jgi:hypothetical protein
MKLYITDSYGGCKISFFGAHKPRFYFILLGERRGERTGKWVGDLGGREGDRGGRGEVSAACHRKETECGDRGFVPS